MNNNTSFLIERLQSIMESQTTRDHEWWDSQAILDENKTPDQTRKEQIDELNKQGVTRPLHKHNQINFNYEKTK